MGINDFCAECGDYLKDGKCSCSDTESDREAKLLSDAKKAAKVNPDDTAGTAPGRSLPVGLRGDVRQGGYRNKTNS